jgi:hypothetical protein
LLLFHEDGHPVQDLHFDGIARLADGQIHLALRGASPWTGYLQVSSNLVNWETITNSYWELQGRGFKETMVTNAPQRFYRTSRLP